MERCNTLADLTESAEHAAACRLARGVYAVLPAVPFVNNGWRDQIERAVTSVVCNVGEGYGRDTPTGMIQFLRYAKGSLFEVVALLAVAPVPTGDLGETAAEAARLIDAAILRSGRRQDVDDEKKESRPMVFFNRPPGASVVPSPSWDDRLAPARAWVLSRLQDAPVPYVRLLDDASRPFSKSRLKETVYELIRRKLVWKKGDLNGSVLHLVQNPVGVGEQEGGHGRAGD